KHALEAAAVEHVGGERGVAGVLDALVAVALGKAEQGVDAPHAGPGQRPFEEPRGETTDRFAVARGLALEELDIAQRVGALLGREVAGVGGAAARRLARMSLDQLGVR